MKNKITLLVVGIIIVVIGIFIYVYGKETPKIEADGKISGNYSIASIMSLGKPYECSFSKSDETSQISGVIRVAENKLRGDIDLGLAVSETAVNESPSSFASHLIITDGTAYIWTSLEPIGYKSPAAKSTFKNASPIEQAQIIGTKDKEDYTCSPWNADLTAFEIPSGITFSELK